MKGTRHKVQGARRKVQGIRFQLSVFPAVASLQTGFPLRSNRFQFFCFSSLTPDTRHLKPWDFGFWILDQGYFVLNRHEQYCYAYFTNRDVGVREITLVYEACRNRFPPFLLRWNDSKEPFCRTDSSRWHCNGSGWVDGLSLRAPL